MQVLFQHPVRYRGQALGQPDVHARPQQDVLQRGLLAVGLLELAPTSTWSSSSSGSSPWTSWTVDDGLGLILTGSLCNIWGFFLYKLTTRRLVPIFYGNLRPAGIQTVWLLHFML